jgi:hypothetical protein
MKNQKQIDQKIFKVVEKLNQGAYRPNWKYLRTKKQVVFRVGRYVNLEINLGETVTASSNGQAVVRPSGRGYVAAHGSHTKVLDLLGIRYKLLNCSYLEDQEIKKDIANEEHHIREGKAAIAKPRSHEKTNEGRRRMIAGSLKRIASLKKILAVIKKLDAIDTKRYHKEQKIQDRIEAAQEKVRKEQELQEQIKAAEFQASVEQEFIANVKTPAQAKLKLEIRNETDRTVRLGNIIMGPVVDENYWTFRVKVSDDQAIVGFQKFGSIGVGFAKEEDGNTNLPSTCSTLEIYNHIKHNKGSSSISRDRCLRAIKLIQIAADFLQYQEEKILNQKLVEAEKEVKEREARAYKTGEDRGLFYYRRSLRETREWYQKQLAKNLQLRKLAAQCSQKVNFLKSLV